MQASVTLGLLSFLLAWIVQSFFSNVLLNIVDVVFICYAMDRDTQVIANRRSPILKMLPTDADCITLVKCSFSLAIISLKSPG